MTELSSKRKFRFTFKTAIAVAAAMALLTAAGGAIASANKGLPHTYDTVVFNGEERKAVYESFDSYSEGGNCNWQTWTFVKDNMQYGVTVYGEFDPETQVLYIEDRDGYVIASDSPNPELNLYTAIDSSPFAEINEEELKVYPTKNPEQSIRSNTPSIDKADGTADGVVWPINSDSENYFGSATTILSNGAVAEAWKDPYVEEEEDFYVFDETLESVGEDE